MPYNIDQFLDTYPSISMIEALITDCNGVARGKWIPRNKIQSVLEDGVKLPKSALNLDRWGRDVPDLAFTTGDIDGWCRAVPDSLTPMLTERGIDIAQLIMTMYQNDGSPFMGDPRQVLAEVVKKFEQKSLYPCVAAELEFSLFPDPGRDQPMSKALNTRRQLGGNLYALDELDRHQEMLEILREYFDVQGLPFEGIIKEAAPNQYEVNMAHNDNALALADQVIRMQRGIRTVAQRFGLIASFMPKPMSDAAGNGMHVHCSLLEDTGANVFNDGSDEGSQLLRYAVGGSLALMPDAMLIFAPSFNAYRRFQPGNHAPTFPAWGYDNRTAAIRIPAGPPAVKRIEHRVAGADTNPYLAIAAVLAGILHGIEQQLEPPAAIEGNAYDQEPESPALPTQMDAAIVAFSESNNIARHLSAEFQRMFTLSKAQELEEFGRQITELEYDSYLRG